MVNGDQRPPQRCHGFNHLGCEPICYPKGEGPWPSQGLNLLRGLCVTSVLQDVLMIDVICCSEENDGTLMKTADPPFQHMSKRPLGVVAC